MSIGPLEALVRIPPPPRGGGLYAIGSLTIKSCAPLVDRDPGDEQGMRVQFFSTFLCKPRTCRVCFTINSRPAVDTSRCCACNTILDEPYEPRTYTREEVFGP